ncbi:Zinc finger, RING-type [Corchorus capsularis]|uniref:Zinc finger, RING-type n=1 Tax=Corchorus capsularis TaxID=210143 RepID=A0A1R3GSA8_COCAP|nr:Zinc finger, RING-type [Corchorus capsularis]
MAGQTETENRSLMIVMSERWFYKVDSKYELQEKRAETERFQLPVGFRVLSGFNGEAPEEFRLEGQRNGVLNLGGWFLDEESKKSIASALSALGISDAVQRIIVNTLFYYADKQSMRVDIARQELRDGRDTMFWDGRSTVIFCPPLTGTVLVTTGQICLMHPTVTSRADGNLLTRRRRELMARRIPVRKSAIDGLGLEKYKLLAVELVAMWRREAEETNSNTTISNSTETGCAICLQEFEVGGQVRRTPCKGNSWHIFHEHCVAKWLQTSRTCPLCRHALPPRHL